MKELRLIRSEERLLRGDAIDCDEEDDDINDDETGDEECSDWGDSYFMDIDMDRVAEESSIRNLKLLKTGERPSLEDWPISRKIARFAEWAFGPEGIPSLEVLVYGDFSHNERFIERNELLCRTTPGTANQERKIDFNFRRMRLKEREDFIREHVEFLEACPSDWLLKDWHLNTQMTVHSAR